MFAGSSFSAFFFVSASNVYMSMMPKIMFRGFIMQTAVLGCVCAKQCCVGDHLPPPPLSFIFLCLGNIVLI